MKRFFALLCIFLLLCGCSSHTGEILSLIHILPDNAAEFSLLLLSQQFCIRATEKRTADERMIFLQLLLKQRMFSWFDSYDIYDEDGNTVFPVSYTHLDVYKRQAFRVKGVQPLYLTD